MELRQLRYFVTLADELHFGRAAAREHIVQSALSQQIRRLEGKLGTVLVERNTHHVRLTASGAVFVAEARQILGHVERAVAAAKAATTTTAAIRVALSDTSFATMARVLGAVREGHPGFEIYQIEAGVPEQYRLLAEGRVDVGIGPAALAPPSVASAVIRLDPMGVLVGDGHRFSGRDSIAVIDLAEEPLLFAAKHQAPEFNLFVGELCRTAGFTPRIYSETAHSMCCAAGLVRERRCLVCAPQSCGPVPGTRWLPLVDPTSHYPWSLLWRDGAENETEPVRSVLRCARALSAALGWTAVENTLPVVAEEVTQ